MLNAGRGNPNRIAPEPRAAFLLLGDHYPLPVRMLPHAAARVRAHLVAGLLADYHARRGAATM